MKSKKFKHYSFEGTVMLYYKKEVCPCCNGEGWHVRRDLDDSKLVDSMREDGDEGGLRGYFRGDYDEVCRTCRGKNVVDAVDHDRFHREYPEQSKAYWNALEEERAYERYAAQERAAGA